MSDRPQARGAIIHPESGSDAIHRLMAKRPADRYQTARDFARDLAKIQKGLPVAPLPKIDHLHSAL